jgi:hypothetical protein
VIRLSEEEIAYCISVVGFHRLQDGLQQNLVSPVITVRTVSLTFAHYVLPTQCVYVFCVDLGALLGKREFCLELENP